MIKAIAALLLYIGLASAALAQQLVPSTTASVPISISSATTTLLITGVANRYAYVTAVDVIAAGTGNIQFIAGTGSTCAGGTPVNLSGAYNLTAQVGFTKGNGYGVLWAPPLGYNICAVTSAAVGMYGSLSYAIF